MKNLTLILALLGSTASAETLTIATGGHFPPYIINPATDRASGLDKDMMDEICERGGFDCVWIDLPMNDIFQALARGEVDVVTGGFGYSTERDAIVDFTCPYVVGGGNTGRFVARNPDVDLITSRIGALTESLYEESMTRANRDVRPYLTEEAALDALNAGDIDVVFGSQNMTKEAANRTGFYELGEYPTFSSGTVLGVAEEAPALRVTLDTLLADLSEDGTLGQMRMKWLGRNENEIERPCGSLTGLT